MRDDLNARAPRRIAVLDPVRLVIDNYPEGQSEDCFAPNHPQHPGAGQARAAVLARALDRARRLPGERRRKAISASRRAPRCGCATATSCSCIGADKDAAGNVVAVHCTYDPETRSGTPGADARKVKGNIHWLSAAHAVPAEVRLYDRLFAVPFPGRAQPVGRARRRRGGAGRGDARDGRRRRGRRRRADRAGRAQLSRRSQSGFEARDHRVRRAGAVGGGAARSASSSSGTAISSPTSPITRRASRCSTAR